MRPTTREYYISSEQLSSTERIFDKSIFLPVMEEGLYWQNRGAQQANLWVRSLLCANMTRRGPNTIVFIAIKMGHLSTEKPSLFNTLEQSLQYPTLTHVIKQRTPDLPGPLEPPLRSLPNLNITALSYSCTTWKYLIKTLYWVQNVESLRLLRLWWWWRDGSLQNLLWNKHRERRAEWRPPWPRRWQSVSSRTARYHRQCRQLKRPVISKLIPRQTRTH